MRPVLPLVAGPSPRLLLVGTRQEGGEEARRESPGEGALLFRTK